MPAVKKINHGLIQQARPLPGDCLTWAERIAINVLHRDGANSRILAKVFGVSPNTIYYSCLTGDAASYPTSPDYNPARDANAIVDRLGVDKARKKYVTQAMVDKVDALNAEKAQIFIDRRRRP